MDEHNLDSQKGKGNGNGNGTGKGKAIATQQGVQEEKMYKWTLATTILFFEALKHFRSKNGFNVPWQWNDVCDDFFKRSKDRISSKTAQNKFNGQRKLWSSWGKIRHLETGIGWDETTGRIIADEEWWERKRKELGSEYATFRKKGVNPELSDLWDDVYFEFVASGKHAVSASMDANSMPMLTGIEELDESDKNEDEEELEYDNSHFINLDSQSTPESHVRIGNTKASAKSGSQEKKRRRPISAATVMQEKIASLADSEKEMVALMRKDVEGINDKSYDEGIAVLERLVESSIIQAGSRVWCFAMTELLKLDKLRTFMKIKNDDHRAEWLKHECVREMGPE